jgi:hypothetical protein
MDARDLESQIRSIPGVVACAVDDAGISVLVAEGADVEAARSHANAIAASAGLPEVRILAAQTAPPARSGRRMPLAAAAIVAAAAAAVAIVLPVGNKLSPRLAPPEALGPGFAPPPRVPATQRIQLPEPVFRPAVRTPPISPAPAAPAFGGFVISPPRVSLPVPSVQPPVLPPDQRGGVQLDDDNGGRQDGVHGHRGRHLQKGHQKPFPGRGHHWGWRHTW